jgi:hypothetical protein
MLLAAVLKVLWVLVEKVINRNLEVREIED